MRPVVLTLRTMLVVLVVLALLVALVCFTCFGSVNRESPERVVEKFTPNEYIRGILRELRVLDPPLFDSLRVYPSNESYTLDKTVIYLCIEDPQTGRYYPRNYLKYVILHEVSHMLCDEIDHTSKFSEIFHGFIKRAVDLGLYDDTVPLLRVYCGKRY